VIASFPGGEPIARFTFGISSHDAWRLRPR
jgi:hypothetical protein